MKFINKIQLIFVVFFLVSCASSGPRYGGGVAYVDPKSVEQTTNQFSMSDIGNVAASLATKMLQSPAIAQSREVVRIQVSDVNNLTAESINMSTVTRKIENVLTNSGKVQFAGSSRQNQAAVDALRMQNQTGLYDQSTTAKLGKMQGAQYRVEGSLTSMTQRGAVKSISYNFELSLIDIQRNVKVWGEDVEIRKVSGN